MLKRFVLTASRRAAPSAFEGNSCRAPALLGWRVEGVDEARIVDPFFAISATRCRAKEPVAMDRAKAVVLLVRLAVREDLPPRERGRKIIFRLHHLVASPVVSVVKQNKWDLRAMEFIVSCLLESAPD